MLGRIRISFHEKQPKEDISELTKAVAELDAAMATATKLRQDSAVSDLISFGFEGPKANTPAPVS